MLLEHEEAQTSEEDRVAAPETSKDSTSRAKWNEKSMKKTLTNKEILAQAIMFLIAGYDTTGTTLCFILYNLAMYRDCQQKLCDEIDRVLEKHVFN